MISMGTLHRILSLLLDERIPITNLTVILEGVSHNAQSCKDPADFAERVRPYLARAICDPFIDADKRLHALVLEPSLEQDLKRSVQDKKLAVSPDIHEALMLKIGIALEAASQKGVNVALLVDSQFRRTFRQFIQRAFPDLSVIAFTEVPLGVTLEADAVIKRNEVYAPHMPVTGGSPT